MLHSSVIFNRFLTGHRFNLILCSVVICRRESGRCCSFLLLVTYIYCTFGSIQVLSVLESVITAGTNNYTTLLTCCTGCPPWGYGLNFCCCCSGGRLLGGGDGVVWMWFCAGGLPTEGEARASGREGSTGSGEFLNIWKNKNPKLYLSILHLEKECTKVQISWK